MMEKGRVSSSDRNNASKVAVFYQFTVSFEGFILDYEAADYVLTGQLSRDVLLFMTFLLFFFVGMLILRKKIIFWPDKGSISNLQLEIPEVRIVPWHVSNSRLKFSDPKRSKSRRHLYSQNIDITIIRFNIPNAISLFQSILQLLKLFIIHAIQQVLLNLIFMDDVFDHQFIEFLYGFCVFDQLLVGIQIISYFFVDFGANIKFFCFLFVQIGLFIVVAAEGGFFLVIFSDDDLFLCYLFFDGFVGIIFHVQTLVIYVVEGLIALYFFWGLFLFIEESLRLYLGGLELLFLLFLFLLLLYVFFLLVYQFLSGFRVLFIYFVGRFVKFVVFLLLFLALGRENTLVPSEQVFLGLVSFRSGFFDDLVSLFPFENLSFSSLQPRLRYFFSPLKVLLLILLSKPHQLQSILNQILLNKVIKRSTSLKARGMVNFDNNGLKIISKHHIKTQDMKTHASFILLRLAVLILMLDAWQSTYH